MSQEMQTLMFVQRIEASPSQVYYAFTNPVALQGWFGDTVEAETRENGRFYAWWNVGYYTSGLFTALEPDKRVSFTWHGLDEPAPTRVDVLLEGQGERTQVTLKHKDVGTGQAWEQLAKGFNENWRYYLENLKSVLERGIDKRFYDRPMLGVMPSDMIDERKAEELGLPVQTGSLLSDVVADQGAAAAGIQGGDVLYSIGGHKLCTFQDFATALSGYKAGDHLEVVYYRQGEQHTVEMLLSGRPYPEYPSTPQELAEALRAANAQTDAEIAALFADVPEQQTTQRPAPNEWSAKEVIAHLLINEHWAHIYVGLAIAGQRTAGYTNELCAVAAIASAYPTTADIIAAFQRSQRITAAAVQALPDEFVARKAAYGSLADMLLNGFPAHTRGHYPQIEAAIQTAGDVD